MELAVIDIKGKKTSKKVKLNDAVFCIEPNDHAIYLDVKHHMANKRTGNHKTKERSDIRGSRRKIRKQKGSGAARVGDIKNPIFRGGGRAFGPRPRDYGFKLNKKVRRLARKSALSHKIKAESLSVLEDFKLDSPKTKEFAQILSNLEVSDSKSLIVISEYNENVKLSSRNLKGTRVVSAEELCTYDILNANKVYLSEGSIEKVEKILG